VCHINSRPAARGAHSSAAALQTEAYYQPVRADGNWIESVGCVFHALAHVQIAFGAAES
jgi:hypothetical protein